MSSDDRKRNAEYCLAQFEGFIRGMQRWDGHATSYCEIHSAALRLCEDDDFLKILRAHWSAAPEYRTLPPTASYVDRAIEVAPDLVSGFFYALIEYMELYKGKIC